MAMSPRRSCESPRRMIAKLEKKVNPTLATTGFILVKNKVPINIE